MSLEKASTASTAPQKRITTRVDLVDANIKRIHKSTARPQIKVRLKF